MTTITVVIPAWLAHVITVYLVVGIALSLYRIKWERRLQKEKETCLS